MTTIVRLTYNPQTWEWETAAGAAPDSLPMLAGELACITDELRLRHPTVRASIVLELSPEPDPFSGIRVQEGDGGEPVTLHSVQ